MKLGSMVLYSLSEGDVSAINRRRNDYQNYKSYRYEQTGSVFHVGNRVSIGQQFPMIVVAVHEDGTVNGQVFLDGNDHYWACAISAGNTAGQFLTE